MSGKFVAENIYCFPVDIVQGDPCSWRCFRSQIPYHKPAHGPDTNESCRNQNSGFIVGLRGTTVIVPRLPALPRSRVSRLREPGPSSEKLPLRCRFTCRKKMFMKRFTIQFGFVDMYMSCRSTSPPQNSHTQHKPFCPVDHHAPPGSSFRNAVISYGS